MYEVRCAVGDNKLASVLKAVKGLTFGLPTVLVVEDTPEVEAPAPRKGYTAGKFKPNKPRKKPLFPASRKRKGQGATQIVRELIARSGAVQITAREMRVAVEKVGYSKGSYSHAIKLLLAEGSLKQVDSFGHYEVKRAAAPATSD